FIPGNDAAATVESPATLKAPAPDAPVEEAIARVDASVQALMRLLPGSTEPELVVEAAPPVVDDAIAKPPVAETAVHDAPPDEPRAEEPPVEEAPVEEAIARVDASVEALMRLLPTAVEVDPIEAPAVEPVA